MRLIRLPLAALLAGLTALTGCSTSSPDVIDRADAQRLSTVTDAIVLSVRPVVIDGSQSGAGGITGAVVGGIAGTSVGGRREAGAVGVLAAVAGAAAGNAIERMSTREQAVEILVQLARTGERRAIIQAQGQEQLQPGDAVLLIGSAGKIRVMKAPPVAASAP